MGRGREVALPLAAGGDGDLGLRVPVLGRESERERSIISDVKFPRLSILFGGGGGDAVKRDVLWFLGIPLYMLLLLSCSSRCFCNQRSTTLTMLISLYCVLIVFLVFQSLIWAPLIFKLKKKKTTQRSPPSSIGDGPAVDGKRVSVPHKKPSRDSARKEGSRKQSNHTPCCWSAARGAFQSPGSVSVSRAWGSLQGCPG